MLINIDIIGVLEDYVHSLAVPTAGCSPSRTRRRRNRRVMILGEGAAYLIFILQADDVQLALVARSEGLGAVPLLPAPGAVDPRVPDDHLPGRAPVRQHAAADHPPLITPVTGPPDTGNNCH